MSVFAWMRTIFQDFFALLGSGNEGGEGMVAIE